MNSFRTQTDAKNNGYLLTKDVEMIIYADTIGLGSLIISMIIFWFFAHAHTLGQLGLMRKRAASHRENLKLKIGKRKAKSHAEPRGRGGDFFFEGLGCVGELSPNGLKFA